MNSQPFQVPLVPQHLPREEMMQCIANSLDAVNLAVSTITNRITSRVTDCKSTLSNLNARIDNLHFKVSQLVGSKNATVMFAPAKYPLSPANDQQFQTLFSIDQYAKGSPADVAVKMDTASKPTVFSEATIVEKQQYYNVKISRSAHILQADDGLGNLPPGLDSISNLLLFNTSQNPYRKNITFDPLEHTGRKARLAVDTVGQNELANAPESILQSDMFRAGERKGSFGYSPGLGQVPEFDVPDLLPDLPGIANLSFGLTEDLPSIAPSLYAGLLDELPEVIPDPPRPSVFNTTSSSASRPDGRPELTQATPPPPEPQLLSAISSTTRASDATARGPSFGTTIPAPPPPPPPPDPFLTSALKFTDTEKAKPAVLATASIPASDSRASLMDAIKQAGGTSKFKFRSVEEQKREKKLRREEQKEAGLEQPADEAAASAGGGSKVASNRSSGDLMGDLKQALVLRRKGISGKADDSANERPKSSPQLGVFGSAMARISEQIPAATGKSANEELTGDWEP